MQMRYFSMFSGIGGFELGIGKKGECIGYSEIDKHAITTYKKHFPTHKNYGDATTIKAEQLPDFDLLCGGFPCQSFSIAGKRMGFKDTRGTLFFDIARIIKVKRPRIVFLENVKGLLNHDEGRTFATILATLDELGYNAEWQVLNSKHYGVPQNRERVFIIGHLRGTSSRQIFPITKGDGKSCEELTKNMSQGYRVYSTKGVSTTLASEAGGIGAKTGLYQISNSSDREFGFKEICPTLQARDYKEPKLVRAVLTPNRPEKRQNGRRFKEEGEEMFTLTGQDIHGVMIPEATKQGYAIAEEGDSINLSIPESNTRRGRVGKGIAQTIDTGMMQHTLQGSRIRRLTPTECERLQGFPDNWTIGSDTQRYKQCGNAVTVNVIEAIVSALHTALTGKD